ncbi:MAG: tetratricopeptide repeat protein [Gammaproteobacteria bacterium]
MNTAHGREDAELMWLELTEAGIGAFANGNLKTSTQRWTKASEAAALFDEDDPRRAASLNNLAVSHRFRNDNDEAERCYRLALNAWDDAKRWADNMQVSVRARSSLFHLRLERKHRELYRQAFIDKHRGLLDAGRAATLNNLAELSQYRGGTSDATRLFQRALDLRAGCLNEDDEGVAVIRQNLASISGVSHKPGRVIATRFRERARRKRWIFDEPPEFTDEGRLMAAILLTQVIGLAPRVGG